MRQAAVHPLAMVAEFEADPARMREGMKDREVQGAAARQEAEAQRPPGDAPDGAVQGRASAELAGYTPPAGHKQPKHMNGDQRPSVAAQFRRGGRLGRP